MTPLSPSPRDKPTSCWALPAKLKMKAFLKVIFSFDYINFYRNIMEKIKNQSIWKYIMPIPTATKKYCSCQFFIWEKRYQSMFQPVRAFFQSEPLKNTFLECLHTIYVEGTHTKTLNFESGPASDNNLESGKVTRGHRNLRSWWKKFP